MKKEEIQQTNELGDNDFLIFWLEADHNTNYLNTTERDTIYFAKGQIGE